jgi:Sulfotransferase family
MVSGIPRPNLFVVGAMRSGTTWLHDCLGQHPAIFMSAPKEPCYFVDPEVLRHGWPLAWRRGYWRGEERYLALFAAAQGKVYVGESSTNYSMLPFYEGVPDRIRAFEPAATIIYIMRHPTERTLSHYRHALYTGRETRPPAQALESKLAYLAASDYATQLEPYLERFGRDRVIPLVFEEMTRDPAAAFAALFARLGLDPGPAGAISAEPRHAWAAKARRLRLGGGPVRVLAKSAAVARLRATLPRSCRPRLDRLFWAEARLDSAELEAARRRLLPVHRQQVDRLAALLGREFPCWTF